jgi:hypothetical protein
VKRFFVIFVCATSLWSQKMVTVTGTPGVLIPVHTALGHLTVIELEDRIENVAAESSAFQIEWRDKTVFVYAREGGRATNLFVWTKQGKAIYELLAPTPDLSQMDVAITTRMPAPPAVIPPHPAEQIPADLMLHGRAVEWAGHKMPKHHACLLVRDVYRQGGRLYLRYQVDNNSGDSLTFDSPRVAAVSATALPASLPAGKVVQLGADRATALQEQGENLLPVLVEESLPSPLAAGRSSLGIIGVRLPAASSPPSAVIVRLWLPIRNDSPLFATVVVP